MTSIRWLGFEAMPWQSTRVLRRELHRVGALWVNGAGWYVALAEDGIVWCRFVRISWHRLKSMAHVAVVLRRHADRALGDKGPVLGMLGLGLGLDLGLVWCEGIQWRSTRRVRALLPCLVHAR